MTPNTLPQHVVDELAAYMDAEHIQRLTINKRLTTDNGHDMRELKIEASAFSTVKVALRSIDD